jgi:hypothetical protein
MAICFELSHTAYSHSAHIYACTHPHTHTHTYTHVYTRVSFPRRYTGITRRNFMNLAGNNYETTSKMLNIIQNAIIQKKKRER